MLQVLESAAVAARPICLPLIRESARLPFPCSTTCSVFSARLCEYFLLPAPLLSRVSCLRSRRRHAATICPQQPSFPYRVSPFPRASFQLPSAPVAYSNDWHCLLTRPSFRYRVSPFPAACLPLLVPLPVPILSCRAARHVPSHWPQAHQHTFVVHAQWPG